MYSETSEIFASLFGGLSTVVCTIMLLKRFRCHFVSCNSFHLLGRIFLLVLCWRNTFTPSQRRALGSAEHLLWPQGLHSGGFPPSARVAMSQQWLVFYRQTASGSA